MVIVLSIVFALILLAGAAAAAMAVLAARRRLRAGWIVEERATRSGEIIVGIRAPGQPRVEITRLSAGLDAATFSDRLATARSEAEDRASALNAGRRRLGR